MKEWPGDSPRSTTRFHPACGLRRGFWLEGSADTLSTHNKVLIAKKDAFVRSVEEAIG